MVSIFYGNEVMKKLAEGMIYATFKPLQSANSKKGLKWK